MKIRLSQPYSFTRQGARDYQEDARFPDTDLPSSEQRFFLVCDGVGGSEHGEIASKTVCRAFAKKMPAISDNTLFSNDDFAKVLDYAYAELDKAARKASGDMATTLTFVCFHAGGCVMAHIGDSRIYQIRPQQGIIYRSDDHSLVNSMVHNGIISPEEAENHPRRNVITRCMEPVGDGQNRSPATLIRTDDIAADDYFLLCSDGVLENITDDQLVEILTDTAATDEDKINQIKRICNDSDDNNTAVLIRMEQVEKTADDNAAQADSPDEKADKNAEVNEQSTRRLERDRQEASEIESTPDNKNRGFLSRLKRIFTSD